MRNGYPEASDIEVAPGVFWLRSAKGTLEPEILARLVLARYYASRILGRFNFPPVIITQGAHYTPSPGRAHDGGGVVDLRSRHLVDDEKRALLRALTRFEFAAYDLGPPEQAPHIHAILTTSSTLTTEARAQAARAPHKPQS